MFSMLKFLITFCFSFLLLSIPVQRKPLFYYLNQWAQPITNEVFSGSKDVLLEGVKKSKSFGQKIFNNTVPQKDEISLQNSSIDKSKKQALDIIDHGEDYTAEEKDMLKKILIEQN
jgi:hypothetical protein